MTELPTGTPTTGMRAAYQWMRAELRAINYPEPWATLACLGYALTARKLFP